MNISVPEQTIAKAAPVSCFGADARGLPLDIRIEADFAFLGADYQMLFAASGADAFRHPLWLDAFYRHLAPARGAQPVVVSARSGDGRLVFVLPLILRRISGLRLLETADLGVSDYSAPVVDTAWRERLAADPTLRGAVARVLPPHDIWRIRPVREEVLAAWSLFVEAPAKRLDFSAHEAALSDPYPAWRAASLTPSYAKYLDRRKTRFLKSGTVQLEQLTGEAAGEGIAALRELRTGRFVGDPIQEAAPSAFYAEVAARGSQTGFARTYRLSHDGDTVSLVFALTHQRRLYYMLIGCDYERFGKHSPGLVFYDLLMADWVAAGGAVFDFTIGDEPFKRDYGTRAVAMFQLTRTPTLKGRLGHAAFEGRAKAHALRERLAERLKTLRQRGGETKDR